MVFCDGWRSMFRIENFMSAPGIGCRAATKPRVCCRVKNHPAFNDGVSRSCSMLSRGPSELCLVKDDAAFEGALAETTASAIAAAARTTGFDLLVFGEGSGDLYAQQTGLLAARMLGVPCVNAVSSIEKTDAGIRVERSLENEVEVIELPLPAAVCVTSDINVPRIPTMKAILGAGKKPAKTLSTADIGWSAPVKTVELDAIEVPPRKERAHEVLEGDSAVADFAARIKSALK